MLSLVYIPLNKELETKTSALRKNAKKKKKRTERGNIYIYIYIYIYIRNYERKLKRIKPVCCILTLDRAVNLRFSGQDPPVKISGSSYVVERKCIGVMK